MLKQNVKWFTNKRNSEGEIVELLCPIGLFNYFNRFNNALHMDPTKPGEGGCSDQALETATANQDRCVTLNCLQESPQLHEA